MSEFILEKLEEENILLNKILIDEINKIGSVEFLNKIKLGLSLNEKRKSFLRQCLVDINKFDIYTTNDLLRCLVKQIFQRQDNVEEYYNLGLSENHLLSKGTTWEFDPCKNGQNLLKHGLGFSAVVSYSGGSFGRLISYTKSGVKINDGEEIEDPRLVVFSKYDNTILKDKFMLDKFKEKEQLCVASIVTTATDGNLRFISSRVIDASNEEQLDIELKNLIKDEQLDQIDKNIMDGLRANGMRILKEYYGLNKDDE